MREPRPTFLVTGSSGFLGARILHVLEEGGKAHRIWIASRGVREAPESTRPSRHYCRLDLSGEFVLPAGVDTIIHVAGEKHDPSRMDEINHHGTRRLVEAANQAGAHRFVYVSSVGVYGVPANSGLITETFPHQPRNPYESSKHAGEECVRELCSRLCMEFIVVQPSNVIGSVPGRSYPLLGLIRMIRKGQFAWFGKGEPWSNYVAVEDAAAAVVVAAERAPSGQTFIINTPEPLSHVVRWIADEVGGPLPRWRFPLWVGSMAAGLGSAAARISGRSMPINRQRFLELTNTTRFDGSALTRTLGFDYALGIERMIRNLVRVYLHEGKL